MVGTRRKSKITSNAEGDGAETSTEHSFTVPIPEDFDVDSLSSILPDFDPHSPSPESIVGLYELLLQQSDNADATQREIDELRAEVEKKDVELDQALQDREQSSKDMELQMERMQEELTQVKQERDDLLASHNELQTRITTLSASHTTSSTEMDDLRHRLEDTEREKRDLISVISRLKQDTTESDKEVSALRADLKEARQEHQTLEGQLREIRATETSTKFKVDSLTQQLQLAQSEVDRVNTELGTKSEEYGTYRRAKQAELVTLQANLSDMTQNHSSAQATLKALQSSYSSQTHQLTQALTKVQDLTGQLAEQEATYSTEANSLRRLNALLEGREQQAKEIIDNYEREAAEIGEKAELHETGFRADVERERKAREAAENRVEQLEKLMEKMSRGELPVPGRGGFGTPRRSSGAFDETHDGMMGLSPTVSAASRVQRSGKSFTEVYTDYMRLQEDFDKKCAEYDHMDRTLTAVLAQIEERAPMLSQQRIEYERLQSESSQLSSQLSRALSERDSISKVAQDNAQLLTKSSRENELLQQQLEDLGRQVRALLKEIGRRDDPNLPSDEELASVSPAENVEDVITNHLVLFRSIDALQDQNQKLLLIVRDLGQKMEREENEYKEKLEKEATEAVIEAHEAMQDLAAQLERQKQSSDGIIQAYVKERDALKAMLARSNQSGGSINGSGDVDMAMAGASPGIAKELAEIQSQFDAYRTEMGEDASKLREESVTAQREVRQLQAQLAKANAKIENQADRSRMVQEQLTLQARELTDLGKRNQQLFDQWTRTDIECGRVTEDYRVATGRLEQLRNETANLRAEKKIWEGVQSRLVEENKSLAMERSHMSDLMANVQKMHNDLERSGENDRRRLENQLQLLENQSQELRNQVAQERDTVRNLSLQKDVEVRDLQNRLDKSVQDLSKTRESLVMAETSKGHLEERIGDLTKHLEGNEEKLAVYEHRSSGSAASAMQHVDMSREQQLEAEVAELRSALKVAELDLAQAKAHVQQFQGISDANETALREFQSTHEEYKTSTEAQIARIQSDRQALEERLQTAQSELAELKTKQSDLQKQFEEDRAAWSSDKRTLEDTIVELSTSEKVSESDRTTRETEVKQQEERAKAAEERYSGELIAHAESIKMLENLKKQLASVQATVRDHQTAAETANAKLTSSEGSWNQQKQTLDNEVKELQKRQVICLMCSDLTEQNNLLHKHLEAVSSQAARIRQAADSTTSTSAGEPDSNDTVDNKLSELRSVVAYLRKEKEIVDLQLELSKQENTRLKTQLDHLQQSLNETRRTLSEERENAVEAAASSAKHNELVERINQLNILRESNATLRADCESQVKRVKDLETKLQALSRQLEPAKEEARVANAELQARDAQIKRLEEENRRWQGRNQQLLTKYDRIDPSEMQALKDEIEKLKTERATSEEALQARNEELTQHKSRVEAVEKNLASYKETFAKNMNNFKAKLGELNGIKSKLTTEKKELEDKISELEGQTRTLQTANDSLQAEKVDSSASVQTDATNAAELAALRAERDQLLAEKATWSTVPAASGGSEQDWETEKASVIAAREQAEAQLKAANDRAESAQNTARNNKVAYERNTTKLQAALKTREEDLRKAAAAQEAAVSAAIEKVTTELQVQSSAAAPSSDIIKKHQEELKALEERLSAKHKDELKTAVEKAVSAAQSSSSTTNSNVDVQATVATAIAAHDKAREAKIAEEISAAVERGRMEAASKMKLKDSQVIRAQNRLKEYEAQIQTWKQEGLIPKDAKISPLVNKAPPPASPATSTNSSASQVVSSTGTTTASAAGAATSNTPLPRKPSVPSLANAPPISATAPAPNATAPPAGCGRGAPAGAARGALRGAMRGAAAAGAGRGAPGRQPGQPLSGGITIQGAAKRPAPEPAADDSLAKRLKPAGGGPVPLRRPPAPAP